MKKNISLIHPILTFFIYKHTPEKYEKLREGEADKVKKYWKYESEFKDFYNRQRKSADANILKAMENKYPTPFYWNDIAGFIAIRIENPIENFRIIAAVWSIKNRRFKTKKVFTRSYGVTETIKKELLREEEKFNNEFFMKVENLLKKTLKEFIRKKGFYFPIKENRVHWDFIKHSNIAAFLKELGSNWGY